MKHQQGIRTLRLVWPFALVIVLQSLLTGGSLQLMSAVRGYVGGESLWSKGFKDAVYHLDQYIRTGAAEHLALYQQAIAIPLGDHLLRSSLEQAEPDLEAARRGLLQGGNHADDSDPMICLFRRFRHFSYFERAVDQWVEGDRYVFQLVELATQVQAGIARGGVSGVQRGDWQRHIGRIDRAGTQAAQAFTRILGEASRAVLRLLLLGNLLAAALLLLLAVLRTRSLLLQRAGVLATLAAERQHAQVTLAAIGDAVIRLDRQGQVLYLNPVAQRLLGRANQTLTGVPLEALCSLVDELQEDLGATLLPQLLAGQRVEGSEQTLLVLQPDGIEVAVRLIATPIQVGGRVDGAVLVLHDMTRERQFMASLSWQASHDALTGLANRREFEQRLAQLLARLEHQPGRHALMFIDLDQFKLVNDTSGHAAGDELLRQVCTVLQQHLREGDTLARLGGDEFGVLLENCPVEMAERIAEVLRKAVEDLRFFWQGRPYSVSASIGLVQVVHAHSGLVGLLRAADLACYSAKEKGRNRVHLCLPEDAELAERVGEMGWVQRLHEALEQDRFVLYAQPIVAAAAADETAHLEVLLRLRDADGRLVGPGSFIPAAERYGLMGQIDRWVVRNTLALLAEREQQAGLICAINLSGTSIGDAEFLDFICEQIASHRLAPGLLCFEITETAAITNLGEATRFIKELKRLGCRFALDDFGAGMSSFSYLKHLPVDYLKIDGHFVRDLLVDPIDRAMVAAIHQIGQVMGKRTIAEFVESAEVREALCAMGVDYVQGYAIGQPRPLLEVLEACARERVTG